MTYTAVVTLKKRTSKNVYDLDSVRLVPLPPLKMPTAQEAKHWGACYALFRVRLLLQPLHEADEN